MRQEMMGHRMMTCKQMTRMHRKMMGRSNPHMSCTEMKRMRRKMMGTRV
jgi:hypothetical protein